METMMIRWSIGVIPRGALPVIMVTGQGRAPSNLAKEFPPGEQPC